MSANTIQWQTSNANWVIPDPGSGGTIPSNLSGICPIETAGSESRTLAAPTKSGIDLTVVAKTIASGTLTVTIGSSGSYTEASDTNFTMTQAGQFITLKSMEIASDTYACGKIAADPHEAMPITTLTATTVNATTVTATVGTITDLTSTNVNVGENGTVGTLDVYPASSDLGKLSITCTNQTGDTIVSLVAGAMGAARTITIRDPGAAASLLTTTDGTAAATTSTAVELTKLDDSVISTTMAQGSGVNGAEAGYSAGYFRRGSMVITRIFFNLDDLIGSATDLDIIGESAAANCSWGQITAALNGTIVGGTVQCLEVPAGGTDDIDFYASNVSTGTQDVIITDAALGSETALVTSGGAWTAALTKVLTGFPAANDYIYVTNGAAAGGTFSAGKFLMTLYGFI